MLKAGTCTFSRAKKDVEMDRRRRKCRGLYRRS